MWEWRTSTTGSRAVAPSMHSLSSLTKCSQQPAVHRSVPRGTLIGQECNVPVSGPLPSSFHFKGNMVKVESCAWLSILK